MRANDPDVAAKGRRLLEQSATELAPHKGQFVAIDVNTRFYYLGKSAVEAIQQAKSLDPSAEIYLAKVGEPAAFKFRR